MRRRRAILPFGLLLLASLRLSAQAPVREQPPRVSLITIEPGASLYSAFGHSAVRIVHPDGRDDLYNYGLSARPFDARLALGMVVGRMPFIAARLDTGAALAFYREAENRSIVEEVLHLPPASIDSLIAALEADTQPERREYNYRFISDNCVSRLWPALGPALGSPRWTERGMTLRRELSLALARDPWLSFAVGLLLGPQADRPLHPGFPPFLPRQLRAIFAEARASAGPEGPGLPLADAAHYLHQGKWRSGPLDRLPPWLIALFLSLASVAATLFGRKTAAAILDGFLAGILLLGFLGIVMFWLLAGYGEAAWNLNLFWANPLPLLALIIAARRSRRNDPSILFLACGAASLLMALWGGLGVQGIPPALRILAAAAGLRWLDRSRFISPLERARGFFHSKKRITDSMRTKGVAMDIQAIRLKWSEGCNIVVGQSHFIKTVEDLSEVMASSVPGAKWGLAFNEASDPRLVRTAGNDEALVKDAVSCALATGAGHTFYLVLGQGCFPINVLDRIKACPEVARVFAATGNPLQAVVARTEQGAGILGVVDGGSPAGVEGEADKAARIALLRKFGYKAG